jgi:hypothetical protein
MRFSELSSRLTGFSTPLFGVSWEPPKPDVQVARQVIVYLEDRRVLYGPEAAELYQECVDSVVEIRRFLTDRLVEGQIGKELEGILSGMRATCRRFLDEARPEPVREMYIDPGKPADIGPVREVEPSWMVWGPALGQFRGGMGAYIGQLVIGYGLDLPDELVPILPAPPEDS